MYLKRIEIQGFKTFAGRTVLEFRPGITAVVGPNGSGKCLVGPSRVTLADGRTVTISELVNYALATASAVETLDDGWLTRENPAALQLLSLNPATFKLEPRPVAGFVKRSAPAQLVRVRTHTGRVITATPYHPLFTLEEGHLRALRADELRPGVRVALARDLSTPDLEPQTGAATVGWDVVTSVEWLSPEEPWVYDLCVAETHNFVAEGLIVHNSNLSDAVRWVLGEQSLTTLRCKRSEELIYSGGGRRAAAGLAEVNLTIDNSDRLLPLDFDEVTITRRATRAGDSDYYINRVRVRLRDVLEATEPLGGSYTIINQGLVDAALTLRPEERRRLFEDAAEIGGFELRKAEAVRRLRETEGNLNRLSDLLAELEPRLRMLKRQATQARQQRELSAELHELHIRHYSQLWQTARSLSARTRTELEQSEAALDQARATQTSVSNELQTLRETTRTRRDELGLLHQQRSALHRRAEAAQRELAVGAERVVALDRRAEDLERRRNELALRRQQAEAQSAEASGELARAETELAQAQLGLGAAEAELTALEPARRAVANELREAQDAALRAAAGSAEQRSRLEQLAAQSARLDREAGELEAALAQAEQQLETARSQVALATTQLEVAELAHTEASAAEQALRQQQEALRSARAHADEERAAARRVLADAEARLDSLGRLARSYAGVFAGVKAAMQWAERSGHSGFALVQSLIRTPVALETAVEVALGSRLQNIVVERWEDAEAAIAELKRSGAGRATFMPLDVLSETALGDAQRTAPKANLEAPVLGIAAELVEFDPHYRRVVWQLLGRVQIVRDLPTARAELRQLTGGWMLVTLSGEQVQSSGSLTGGARTKESGALRRERELRELPAQVEAARQALEASETQRAESEARAQALTAQLRDHDARVREAQRQREAARVGLEAAGRRQAQAEQERTWSVGRRERQAHEREGLAQQHAQVSLALASAETQARATAERVAALRARQEAEAQATGAAQERLASLRATAASAEAQLRASRSLRSAHAQTLALIAQQEHDLEQAQLALAGEREALAGAHERAEAASNSLLVEINALHARIDPTEVRLREDEAHLAELEQREKQATTTLREHESAQSRAALEAQRAADRQEALLERAAADGVEVGDESLALETAQLQPDEAQAQDLEAQIAALKNKILRLGAVNPLALEEYEETAERQRFLTGQLEDLREAGATLLELLGELDQAMSSRFQATFNAVAAEFEQSFTRLFGGGSAKLVLTGGHSNGVGPDEPAQEGEPAAPKAQGVEIIARPPGKKQQSISLLSGGERTLTAAALLFAILKVNPSPFCILDETDAALDESNVGRFREALRYLTEQTQFILITHNRGTIEAADTLYGVTMGDDGASKLMSLRVESYIAVE